MKGLQRIGARLGLAAVATLSTAWGTVLATADGPDDYAVIGVADDDTLNIRAAPDPHAAKVGEIPPGGTCIRNLGCRGGLTLQEFTEPAPRPCSRAPSPRPAPATGSRVTGSPLPRPTASPRPVWR
jgi:hypothetical protein